MTSSFRDKSRSFRVVDPKGFEMFEGTTLLCRLPYCAEFTAERLSWTHVRLCDNGMTFPVIDGDSVYAVEVKAIEDMNWNITIRNPQGVDVYSTSDFDQYLYTMPMHMRLLISARSKKNGCDVFAIPTGYQTQGYVHGNHVHNGNMHNGNAPNGNDGDGEHSITHGSSPSIDAMTEVLFGKVANTDGVLVRQTKEIDSPVIGYLNMHDIIYIQGKDFSEMPLDKNVHRYQLHGNQGWINVYPQDSIVLNVQLLGHLPSTCTVDTLSCPIKPILTLPQRDIMPMTKSQAPHNIHNNICVSCMIHESNALFLHHGDYGHRVCCMTCAQKVVARGMSCPICRLEIERVIQVF